MRDIVKIQGASGTAAAGDTSKYATDDRINYGGHNQ